MRKIPVIAVILILLACAIFLKDSLDFGPASRTVKSSPQRIVSLSPGITETLCELGLGDRLVGVTRFCAYPEEVRTLPKVAGFREINLEAIARTMPDLVVLPEDMVHFTAQIENMGIPVFSFAASTLTGYARDAARLAEYCGVDGKAASFLRDFELAALQARINANSKRPSLLFAILNPEDCGRPLTEISVLGKDGFYNELISMAGARNAYEGQLPYPRISAEALLALDPDIIVATASGCQDDALIRENWRRAGALKALANGLFVVLEDPGHTIPGPRSLATLKAFSAAVDKYRTGGGAENAE